jgi:hypothetical protein
VQDEARQLDAEFFDAVVWPLMSMDPAARPSPQQLLAQACLQGV